LPKLTTSRRSSRSNYWNAIVTPQTSAGKVHKVLVAEDVYYPGESETSEFYVSVLLNRATGRNMIMYSTEGGMDIEEEVAEHTPFNFHRRN
jgi:succinyl-CoA synthetase beta subunit